MKKSTIILTLALSIFGATASTQAKPETFVSSIYKASDDQVCVYVNKSTRAISSVSIYDSEGSLITRSIVPKHVMKSGYKFDVSQLSAGDYSIIIRNKSEEEVHNLAISAPQVVTERSVAIR
jgi:hypothetical protein